MKTDKGAIERATREAPMAATTRSSVVTPLAPRSSGLRMGISFSVLVALF